MRPGSHAAGDGSFGRSAGTHLGKAVALVAVAVLIGALLLHHNGGSIRVAVAGQTSTTKRPKAASTVPSDTTTVTQALRAPADVKVLVANGTTTAGLATRYSDKLHGLGYNTLASTNTTAKGVQATVVYYAPGYQQEAIVVATQGLGLKASAIQPMPPTPQIPVAAINGANILVIVGSDLAVGATSTTVTTRRSTVTTVRPTTTTARATTTSKT